MLAAIITTVASTAILAGLGVAWRWGSSLPGSVRRRYTSDHQTLHAGPWQVHLPPDCDSADARMVVVCAPSRRLHTSAFSPDAAVAFAHQQLLFAGEPAYSSVNDGVRLEPVGDTGGLTDFVWVCTNGKIHVSLMVPITIDPETGRRQLDLMELVKPLERIAEAVGAPQYRQLYELPVRGGRLKMDWLIGVSMYSRPAPTSSVPSWNDLVFPGTPPPRLVTNRDPFCPPAGYAAGALNDWDGGRTVELLRTFLESFLAENGYHDFQSVIDSTIARYA